MMTNTMTMPMRRTPCRIDPRQESRRRARRRRARWNTILEGLATIGLGVCFILCAVMLTTLA